MGLWPRGPLLARVAGVGGIVIALAAALSLEGFEGAGVAGAAILWPAPLRWTGMPPYRSDTLAAGLGVWCLLVGGLCLLARGWIAGSTESEVEDDGGSAYRWATGLMTIALLYSLVHTFDLLALAGHVLALAAIAWAQAGWQGHRSVGPGTGRQMIALSMAAACLLGAALLVGRATGGEYGLSNVSLSALTLWPLVLFGLFVIIWSGGVPFTGWSACSHAAASAQGALMQALVVPVPVLVLVLRLQALVTAQALAGTVPSGWAALMSVLGWAGGLTALVAGAGMLVWAGTTRWSALTTAYFSGLVMWALALDNPAGRHAALAVLLAFSLGRATMALAVGTDAEGRVGRLARGIAAASLASAPLTAGFVGVWVLATAVARTTAHPAMGVVVMMVALIGACGLVLGFLSGGAGTAGIRSGAGGLLAVVSALALVLGGAAPALWLRPPGLMAGVAGGSPIVGLSWVGLQDMGLFAPVALLAGGAVVLGALAWLVAVVAGSGVPASGPLLPPALDRVSRATTHTHAGAAGRSPHPPDVLLRNPPALIWWLSLGWLEAGIWGFGSLLGRLGMRSGGLLGRLEGRYYMPLAIILILLALLVVSR